MFSPDYDRIMPWLENAMQRMPVFAELGIKRELHGAISRSAGRQPADRPGAGLKNFWLNCGCQIGIGWGPGLTRELARQMVHGSAYINMREFDPRRFGPYADQKYQVTKAREDYMLRHEIPFPHFNRLQARPVKPSALYQDLKGEGAVFEEVFGHERPRWFARAGIEALDIYGFRRTKLHDIVGAEVRAVRQHAGIMDISAFTKVWCRVRTPRLSSTVVPNRVPARVGRVALTQLPGRQRPHRTGNHAGAAGVGPLPRSALRSSSKDWSITWRLHALTRTSRSPTGPRPGAPWP